MPRFKVMIGNQGVEKFTADTKAAAYKQAVKKHCKDGEVSFMKMTESVITKQVLPLFKKALEEDKLGEVASTLAGFFLYSDDPDIVEGDKADLQDNFASGDFSIDEAAEKIFKKNKKKNVAKFKKNLLTLCRSGVFYLRFLNEPQVLFCNPEEVVDGIHDLFGFQTTFWSYGKGLDKLKEANGSLIPILTYDRKKIAADPEYKEKFLNIMLPAAYTSNFTKEKEAEELADKFRPTKEEEEEEEEDSDDPSTPLENSITWVFKGKDYEVDPKNAKVYKENEDGFYELVGLRKLREVSYTDKKGKKKTKKELYIYRPKEMDETPKHTVSSRSGSPEPEEPKAGGKKRINDYISWEYKGEDYVVDEETGKVYKEDENGEYYKVGTYDEMKAEEATEAATEAATSAKTEELERLNTEKANMLEVLNDRLQNQERQLTFFYWKLFDYEGLDKTKIEGKSFDEMRYTDAYIKLIRDVNYAYFAYPSAPYYRAHYRRRINLAARTQAGEISVQFSALLRKNLGEDRTLDTLIFRDDIVHDEYDEREDVKITQRSVAAETMAYRTDKKNAELISENVELEDKVRDLEGKKVDLMGESGGETLTDRDDYGYVAEQEEEAEAEEEPKSDFQNVAKLLQEIAELTEAREKTKGEIVKIGKLEREVASLNRSLDNALEEADDLGLNAIELEKQLDESRRTNVILEGKLLDAEEEDEDKIDRTDDFDALYTILEQMGVDVDEVLEEVNNSDDIVEFIASEKYRKIVEEPIERSFF